MRTVALRMVLLTLLLSAAPAAAQQTAAKGSKPAKPAAAKPPEEVELKFEREYFVYPVQPRRDPFASLAARNDLGPRFEDLSLQGVIVSADGRSVALLSDGTGRIYRVRRGDLVGNARVISIADRKVVFAVENFGIVRQEELVLKRNNEEGGRP